MGDIDKKALRRGLAIAATALTLVPALIVLITRTGREYLPTQDIGVIDMRVRDVWSGDLPLVGVYSRFGWNHPGPLFYWLLAPLNALFGGASWTTLVGHAFLQVVAVVVGAWVAWRRGGLTLVLGILGVFLLTYVTIGDYLLFEAWNPHVSVVVFPVFVLAVWGVALGDPRDLVVAVLTGTFLMQAHVAYVPLVGSTALVALVFLIADARARRQGEPGRGERVRWRTPVIVSSVALVLMWLPVVYEQLTESPGNLRALASYFLHNHDQKTGFSVGAGLLAAMYNVMPPWLGGAEHGVGFTGATAPVARFWLVIPVVALVAAGIVSFRRRDRAAFRWIVVMATLNLAGALSLARVTGPPFPYLFYWRVPLAPLTFLAVAWALLRGTGLVHVTWVRVAAYAVLSGIVVVSVAEFTNDVVDHPSAVRPIEPVAEAMVRPLERAADHKTVMIRIADAALGGLQGGVFDVLDHDGYDVRVDPNSGFQFGESRVARVNDVDSVWYAIEESGLTSVLSGEPGAKVLAKWTPLGPAEDAELTRLHRELADELRAQGRFDDVSRLGNPLVKYILADAKGLDPATVDRVAELNQKVAERSICRCSVIAFPPDEVPKFSVLGIG